MEVVYTRHAKGRMRWREITKAEVERVLREPDRREWLGTGKFHCFRIIGQRHLRVTVALEGSRYIVISAVDKSE